MQSLSRQLLDDNLYNDADTMLLEVEQINFTCDIEIGSLEYLRTINESNSTGPLEGSLRPHILNTILTLWGSEQIKFCGRSLIPSPIYTIVLPPPLSVFFFLLEEFPEIFTELDFASQINSPFYNNQIVTVQGDVNTFAFTRG